MFRAPIASCLAGLALATGAHAGASAPIVKQRYSESVEAPIPQAPIAKGAPNVIVILFDDLGFGAASAFGGLVNTPALDALADGGLRYTNFHTTSVCSPTRAALLTGRNHNAVGMGFLPQQWGRAGFPGYTGRMDPKDGTIAEYLRRTGYSTYAIGKWHLTPDEESTDLGPFDRWPTGMGFEHYFGFLYGATDQYKPDLVEETNHVRPDGRHVNAQLFDKAISYIDRQERLNAAKPFFMYIATGATHSPHQVDAVWSDRYRGKFDAGWDVYRAAVLDRQKRMGLVPRNAKLPPHDPRVPAWNSLSADQKKAYARYMEGFAGFLEYTDYEIGRLVQRVRSDGGLENTAIFVILGDNGASSEGGPNGSIRPDMAPVIGDDTAQIADALKRYDQIGTGQAYSNYPIGWAEATNTPFRQWKSHANAEGGTRNPMIVSWPTQIPAGGVRTQYAHVIDILPTVMEMAGAKAPETVGGISQTPIQGTSLAYSFPSATAPARHKVQYYFLLGSGGIYDDGWKASFAAHPDGIDVRWAYPPMKPLPDIPVAGAWELYNVKADFNETKNVAAQYPEKLKELQEEFHREAVANNAYPLMTFTDWAKKFPSEEEFKPMLETKKPAAAH